MEIMAIPKEIRDVLDFSNTEPVLKPGATDQQKLFMLIGLVNYLKIEIKTSRFLKTKNNFIFLEKYTI